MLLVVCTRDCNLKYVSLFRVLSSIPTCALNWSLMIVSNCKLKRSYNCNAFVYKIDVYGSERSEFDKWRKGL